MKTYTTLWACFLTAAWAGAAPNKNYPKIDDTSYTEPNGDRVIRLSVEAPASADEVWRILTTAEGWKSFAVAFAAVDLRIGGIIETSYNAKAQMGDPDNIKNQITAYIPGRMIALRCIQTPRNFQYQKEFFATATVLEIVPLKKKKARIVLTAVGYKAGEAYDTLYQHFRWGDAFTLDKLRLRLERGQSIAPSATESIKGFNTNRSQP